MMDGLSFFQFKRVVSAPMGLISVVKGWCTYISCYT